MKLMRLLASLPLLAAFAGHGIAQCPTPDGLDFPGAVCAGAWTNVPQKGFGQAALGICWKDCGLDAQAPYQAAWGSLNPVLSFNLVPPAPSCGWYTARLNLYDGNGLQWTGNFFFCYSRTWLETPTVGQFIQVWRYLVNGDMAAMTPNALPCEIGRASCRERVCQYV